ncbi:hypothetical protein H4J51_08535 [Colwellia sp. MB02u-18]|uniref:hypothetical protein n=1 Tax=unclassified Colwellia TaxID=196834 RepID=UPI0015F46F05|nr:MULTISPECIES: hypothetical protein [unclassified Colwellia]MBA6225198.1 hypothetical protein [Colwellia sp. MB3u-45]MBA6266333.1 hypothetical protein [Colwellia sp. MB3u-43]MBA6322964.1 hypothetical protein [Colwellia sp. MB02u-19]MBA6324628.1 hypothetical protein [Colwellia sp. MB02u-18]MBA6331181.1 hypothetical protein [Colwellia sp. MB02u-12]
MSFTKLLSLLWVVGLSGCSSNPSYNSAASCGSLTPVCLAIAATEDMITNDGDSSRKCSDMTGDKRKSCEAQVESLKKHISDASNK